MLIKKFVEHILFCYCLIGDSAILNFIQFALNLIFSIIDICVLQNNKNFSNLLLFLKNSTKILP